MIPLSTKPKVAIWPFKQKKNEYESFWIRDGNFDFFLGGEHVDYAWDNWGDEITQRIGVKDPGPYQEGRPQRLTEFDPMFKLGWIRGSYSVWGDELKINLHHPQFENNVQRVKNIVNKLLDLKPELMEMDLSKGTVTVEHRPNEIIGSAEYKLPDLLGMSSTPKAKQDNMSQQERARAEHDEFWEPGPADAWLERIRRERGVANWWVRRLIRAEKLLNILTKTADPFKNGPLWWRDGKVYQVEGNHMPTAKGLWPDEMENWNPGPPDWDSIEDYTIPWYELGAIRGGARENYVWFHGPMGRLRDTEFVKRLIRDLISQSDIEFSPDAELTLDMTDKNGNYDYVSTKLGPYLPASNPSKDHDEFWEPGPADEWISRIHRRIGLGKAKIQKIKMASVAKRDLCIMIADDLNSDPSFEAKVRDVRAYAVTLFPHPLIQEGILDKYAPGSDTKVKVSSGIKTRIKPLTNPTNEQTRAFQIVVSVPFDYRGLFDMWQDEDYGDWHSADYVKDEFKHPEQSMYLGSEIANARINASLIDERPPRGRSDGSATLLMVHTIEQDPGNLPLGDVVTHAIGELVKAADQYFVYLDQSGIVSDAFDAKREQDKGSLWEFDESESKSEPKAEAPSLMEMGGCPDCGARKQGPVLEHQVYCPRMYDQNKMLKFRARRKSRLSKLANLTIMNGVEEDIITPIVDRLTNLPPSGLWDVSVSFNTDETTFQHVISAKGVDGSYINMTLTTETPTRMSYVLDKINFELNTNVVIGTAEVSNSKIERATSRSRKPEELKGYSVSERANRKLEAYGRYVFTSPSHKHLNNELNKMFEQINTVAQYMFSLRGTSGAKQ